MNFLEDTRKVINYIENNLENNICLDDITQISQLSKFHYIRVFKALTGITLTEYVRRRRLSNAARELIETTKPIIELAFFYGYQSQEAFTRAFKQMYGLTPKAYRLNKIHFANLDQVVFDEKILKGKNDKVEIDPIFLYREKMKIIGMPYVGYNENRDIPKLWNKFAMRMSEIKDSDTEFSYGYETYLEYGRKKGVLTYIAGLEVHGKAIAPPGMTVIEIPANNYAAFPIPAVIDDVTKTIRQIYAKLLLELNLEPCDTYDFELYDEKFVPNDVTSIYYLCIPIK